MSLVKKIPILRSFPLMLPGPNGRVIVNVLKGNNYLIIHPVSGGLIWIKFSYKDLSEWNPSAMPVQWLNTNFKYTNKINQKAFEKMLTDFREKTGEKE